MHFQSITFIFGGLLAQGLMANPISNPEGLMERDSTTVEGGRVVTYTDAETTPIAKRWCLFNCAPAKCADSVKCDDKNGGPQDTCNKLVDFLYNYPDNSLEGMKQTCFISEAKQTCCLKWTKTLTGAKNNDIKELAADITKGCNENGVSAKFNKITIKNTCTTVCMNNGHKCSNKA